MGLLHQQADASLDPGHCGLIELAQASWVALLRQHAGIVGEALNCRSHGGAIELPAAPCHKDGPAENPRALDVVSQLLPQGGGNIYDPLGAVGGYHNSAFLHGFHSQLG